MVTESGSSIEPIELSLLSPEEQSVTVQAGRASADSPCVSSSCETRVRYVNCAWDRGETYDQNEARFIGELSI
jgi:hypothetical protein